MICAKREGRYPWSRDYEYDIKCEKSDCFLNILGVSCASPASIAIGKDGKCMRYKKKDKKPEVSPSLAPAWVYKRDGD